MIVRPPEFRYPNPYADGDAILGPWAEERGVRVFIADRGDEVRGFDVRNLRGNKYQIWFHGPLKDGAITLKVWRRDNRGTVDFTGGLTELRDNLDRAFALAMSGRPTGQSTRLPPPRWVGTVLRWLRLDKP